MGIRPKKKSGLEPQFIARPDAAKELMVYKWPDRHVRMLSVVTVQSDEWLFFVKGGEVAGYLGAGQHVLDGAGVPFLQHIVDEKSGGNVLIAEVYFVSAREFANRAFAGSGGEVSDPGTEVMVKTNVYGEYAMKAVDPAKLVLNLLGTRALHGNQEIQDVVSDHLLLVLRAGIQANVTERGWDVLKLTSGAYNVALADAAVTQVNERLGDYGLQVTRIEDFTLSIDAADRGRLQEIHDRKAKMALAADPNYAKMAEAEAILGAAEGMRSGSGGGGGGIGSATDFAGVGIGLGIGMKVADRFMDRSSSGGGGGGGGGARVMCPACAAEVTSGAFCSACGAALKAEAGSAPAENEG